SLNVGYNQLTRPVALADPNADTTDIPYSSSGNLFTEIRPALSLQTGWPRLAIRAGYQFSANMSLLENNSTPVQGGMSRDAMAMNVNQPRGVGYSNGANVAGAAQLTQFTLLTLSGAFAQGSTAFLQSARPAEAGAPELRAPGSPSTVSGSA